MFFASAVLVAAPLALAASIERLEARQSACSAVHIFLAKGNNEPYPGRQGKLVNAICSGLASCDYEDIQFVNPVEAPYCGSVNEGVANGLAQITAYNERCPETKLVVSGYSQGAQIVSDILGGGGGVFFQNCVENTSAGIDVNSPAGKKIAAALVFGNTRHTANQPYNVLSGAGANGLFPRSGSQAANLLTYTSKFHDYCAIEDPICAGGDIVADHLNYFDIYSDSAAAWVQSKLAEAPSGIPSSTISTVVAPVITTSVAPFPTTSTVVITTPAAPFPTTAYSNGTATTCTAIIPIPTPKTSLVVSVPAVTLAPSVLSSYTSMYPIANPTTVDGGVPSFPTTVVGGVPSVPTTTGVASNGTVPATGGATVPVTGGAQGMLSAPIVGTLGLVVAGALLVLV